MIVFEEQQRVLDESLFSEFSDATLKLPPFLVRYLSKPTNVDSKFLFWLSSQNDRFGVLFGSSIF